MTRQEAKEICEKRALGGERFTAMQLTAHLERHNGGVTTIDGADCFRIADAVIQKLRRAGKISFVREGREIIWIMQ